MSDVDFLILPSTSATRNAYNHLVDWAEDLHLLYAWATTGGDDGPWRDLPLAKVRRAVIGIEFAQTEPDLLRALSDIGDGEKLRVIEDTHGVYHPKLLLGTSGDQVRAIFGSSNFTAGGFGNNTELNAAIEGPSSEPQIRKLRDFIDAQWSSERAKVPTEDWFEEYAELYRRRPEPPRMSAIAASPQAESTEAATIATAGDLEVSWEDYFQMIASQHGRPLTNEESLHIFNGDRGSYLEEARMCRRAFQRNPSFSDMPERDRKLVAGWGPDSSGHFGRMKSAGIFKRITRKQPERLAKYLDRLPMTGDVPRDLATELVAGLTGLHRVGLSAATRLLAMKRPDQFLVITGANENGLRRVFGSAPTTTSSYIKLLSKLQQYPWFSAPEPTRREHREVWKARLAILDALLYERSS